MAKKEIWVYTEMTNGEPAAVYYELLAKADELAAEKDWAVASVLIGTAEDIDAAAAKISTCTDKIYAAGHASLSGYTLEKYACVFEALIRQYEPEMVLVGATGIGSELAPTVAAKVKTGLAAHCIDIQVDHDNDRVNCMVPAFGGKVVSEIYIPNARPMMASVRLGILEKGQVARACSEKIEIDTAFLDGFDEKETFLEFIPDVRTGIALEEANVVVAAGRGISDEQAWESVNEAVERLGGAVAWSRNFIDLGMVDSEFNMIGTSGKSVKPDVFIGAGISGAAHFVCGMNKSKLVINVNKDEKAKIFNYSNYGVVGDAGKFLRELNKLLQ